jgi:hypothetical protein
MQGLLDLVSRAPAQWNNSLLDTSTKDPKNRLSSDLCMIDGKDYFVRGTLDIPLVGGGGEHFAYGIWSSLSETNFRTYVESFSDPDQGRLGPWFGWFSSSLKGYPETLSLKCNVQPRSNNQRPSIVLEPTDHPLAVEQRDGMSYERLIEIISANGHVVPKELAAL